MNSILLESAIKVSLVLGLVALINKVWRTASASSRHILWVVGLTIGLALPFATPFAPARLLPILPDLTSSQAQDKPQAPVAEGRAVRITKLPSAIAAASSQDAPIQLDPWLMLWLAGAGFIVVRYGIGAITLTRFLKANVQRADANLDNEAREMGLSLTGRVWISNRDIPGSAMTWGLRKPIILLPKDADLWSSGRREAVLRHEIAHVQRFDFASQLLAELACALYWFNPIVWLGARAMRAEAESAADDAVLRSGMRASDYASELLKFAAEIGSRRPTLARVGIPILMQPKIENRLQSVLSPALRRRGLSRPQILVAFVATVVAVPFLAGFHAVAAANSAPRSSEEINEARNRLKQVALATLMYCSDYDDRAPSGRTTAAVVSQLMPYAKNQKIFQSPAAKGKFEFLPSMRAIELTKIHSPAETVTWKEVLPDPKAAYVVAFIDGHVKVINAPPGYHVPVSNGPYATPPNAVPAVAVPPPGH